MAHDNFKIHENMTTKERKQYIAALKARGEYNEAHSFWIRYGGGISKKTYDSL